MARFVHLNGPPGIGKSTLAARYVDQHAGTLNLDVDTLHRLVGGWQDEENRTWQVVWPLARAMAATHLDGGRDVIMPQYFGKLANVTAFEDLAREHGADFREVVLLDARDAAIERFDRRGRDDDDPWVRHQYRLVGLRGGPVLLGTMYDDLMAVIGARPAAVVVPSVAGAVRETYERLVDALREPVP